MRGLVTHKLPDPAWGFPLVARVIPNEDSPWGLFHFLVGTVWEQFFPRVPTEVLDMALRGHATPLLRVLGPPPRGFLKRLPLADGQCDLRKTCISHTPGCVPGPSVPACWEPSTFRGEEASLVSDLVRVWAEGTVVIVNAP